jgi:TPR repeat protein
MIRRTNRTPYIKGKAIMSIYCLRFCFAVFMSLVLMITQSSQAIADILALPQPKSQKEYDALKQQALRGSPEAADKMVSFFALVVSSKEGFYWALIAAENGSRIGAYNVASFLSDTDLMDHEPYGAYQRDRIWFWLKRAEGVANADAVNALKQEFPCPERMRPESEKEIRRWNLSRKTLPKFKRAAMLGSPGAAYRLYQYYSSSDKKQKGVLFWATIAAQNDHPEAPFIVGSLMLESSDRKDKERAIFWLSKAARTGNKEAGKMLNQALRKKR